MFDNQHDCQASVGSCVLCGKTTRIPVALSATASIPSALAPLLIKETVFLLSEFRQASERHELAHDSTCPILICPEPEVADLDFEVPFLCGLGTGVLIALALAVILRYLCSSRVEPATLRVRRVRLNHSEDVRTEESNVNQGSRIVVSYPGEPDRLCERILGWPVGRGTCWVSVGGDSRFVLKDLGSVAGLFDVTGQSDCPRNVVNLEQIMDAPCEEDVRFLIESRGRSGGTSPLESCGRSTTGRACSRTAVTSHGWRIAESHCSPIF